MTFPWRWPGVVAVGSALLLAGCSPPPVETSAAVAAPQQEALAGTGLPTQIEGFMVEPASISLGETVVDHVRVVPRVGQALRVEVHADSWRAVTRARIDDAGRAVVRVRPPVAGRYRIRLVAGSAGGEPATTPFRMIRVVDEAAGSRGRYVYATGDIGECGGQTAATARLMPDEARVIALGDLAYPTGSAASFASCYLPYYGTFVPRTFPVPGNHEYRAADLAYFDVFGPRKGTRVRPWYSVRFGKWRFLMLDSNCARVGGCDLGSRQDRWLKRQLADRPSKCLAAVWHAPRWSSGHHGGTRAVASLYRRLVRAGGDLVLSGHDHDYERFAKLGARGRPSGKGMRQFVVGTGGAGLRPFGPPVTGSRVRSASHHGVLRLRLTRSGYSWRFLSIDGAAVDKGSASC